MKIEENQSQRQSARSVEAVAPLEERLRPYLFSPLHEVWIAAGQQEAPAAKACSLQDILAGGRTSAYLPVHKVHGAPVLDLTEAIQEETSQRKSDQAYDAKDEGLARWMETFPALRLAEPGSDQRIRFFSLLDPDHRASEAAFLPSCHPLVEEAKRDVLRDMERERAVSIQDKVAQRNRADAIGIFLQPRFADIRYLLHPSEMQVLGFLNIDFSGMPVKELLEPGGALQEIIFENPFDGFVLSRSEGSIGISSCSPRVKQAMAAVADIQDPVEKISEFFLRLSQSQFAVLKISMRPHVESALSIGGLLDVIAQEQVPVYIKSTRTAGGVMILRVEGDGKNGLSVKSDSPEYQEVMDSMEENRRTRLQQSEERLASLQEKKAPSVIIDSEEKLIAAHQQPVSARTLLSQILATLEQPILETEIPTERVKGQKGEFRIICQRPSLSGELEVIAAYTKVSDKEIAANISLGGHGEHVQDFICGIYRARCPELDETAVQTRSAADTAELMGKARDFARQYTERLMLDGGPRLNDFALDICPVWNAERAAVDFHFLEVQNGYAFEALKLLDAEAAARVTAGKERLTMGKRDVERGLLDGIALPDLSGLKLPRKQR